MLLTIGSVVGTGIFITTGDIARALPSPTLILLVWIAGGLLTLTGALTYAELGVMFPKAGGIYHFLREAYGPLPAFLYGWTSFLVIMSGGIAAIAVGFAEYLGSFIPFLSTRHILVSIQVKGLAWTLSGGQLAAVGAILFLTAVNYAGLKQGAWVQNLLTVIKVGALGAFVACGLLAGHPPLPSASLAAPPDLASLLPALGVGMIAVLWTFDGWYGITLSAGELRKPERDLPLGIIGGTAGVTVVYVLLNLVYLRALPVGAIAATPRVGEEAALALFGTGWARLFSLTILISAFGCLAATILYAARIYLPMAEDGLFFRSLGEVHPRFRTPGKSLVAQGVWSALLTLSGRYDALYTYTVFAVTLFGAATGAAVFVLRRRRPEIPRAYRVWGYPIVPALFVLSSLFLVVNTLSEKPLESCLGLGIVALGLPAYSYWRRRQTS